MKTIFLLAILLLTVLFSDAQITLTSANIPVAGDYFDPRSCTDTLPDVGPSGANVTWDFSSLVIDYGFTVTMYYSQQAAYSNLYYSQSMGMSGYSELYHSDSTTFNQTGISHYNGIISDGYDF